MMLKFVALALFGLAVCNAALIGGGLVGEYKDATGTDDDVQKVLSFAEAQMNARSNSMYSSRVAKVIKVQRQLVNGINYKVEFEFERTTCSKMSMITLESCPQSGDVDTCTVQVYTSFSGDMSINDFNCSPLKRVQKRAGGVGEPVANPEDFRDSAIRALSQANSDLDTESFKVLEVRTQTVAGQNIYMKLEGLANGVLTQCDMTVWYRAWIQGDEGFQVTKNDCSPVTKEKRNEIGGGCPGCISDETTVDKASQALLFNALNEDNSNFVLDVQKTKFVSMTTQVVAGLKYTYTLQTEVEGKMKDCQISIVDAPWMSPPTRVVSNTCA